jgi:hypothetical protein
MSLTTDEWRDTAMIFTESVEFALNNIAGPNEEMRDRLTDFLMSLILAEKPYLLASARGLDHAVDLVFMDPDVCDFILMIVFVFFSRWAASPERYANLAESLAFAVAADTPHLLQSSGFLHPSRPASQPHASQRLVATPVEIHESLPDPELAGDLLLQNKWLGVLLLIHLFVMPPRNRRGSRSARGDGGSTGSAGTGAGGITSQAGP